MFIKKFAPVVIVNTKFWVVSSPNGNWSIFRFHGGTNLFRMTLNGSSFDADFLFMPYVWIWKQIRKLLPSAYWVGLQDCDSGGRVCNSFIVLAFNQWHLNKLEKQIDGMGDGEVWQSISLYEYFKLKLTKWKHGE